MSDTMTEAKPGWLTVNGKLLGDDDHIDVDIGKLWSSMRRQSRLLVWALVALTLSGVFLVGVSLAEWIVGTPSSCPAEEVMFIDVDSLAEWGVAGAVPPGPAPVMPAGEL